jgi:predicted unusual protein kinase regulating ubiquinone biosynthesis (AarF/ABC1/UbiB family)
MGNYLTACSVKMDKVNAIYHSRTDDDNWDETLEYRDNLYLKLTEDKYNAYLMKVDEKGKAKDAMDTALLRFILGEADDGEEQSKYGYLYLAFCRSFGQALEPDFKMSTDEIRKVGSLFREHSVDIDIWNIAYRYDENIYFKEPSREAMWPLIGYYKNEELIKQLEKIPTDIYKSHEFVETYVNWLNTAINNKEDLVLFYF